jgi:hypothetical protein
VSLSSAIHIPYYPGAQVPRVRIRDIITESVHHPSPGGSERNKYYAHDCGPQRAPRSGHPPWKSSHGRLQVIRQKSVRNLTISRVRITGAAADLRRTLCFCSPSARPRVRELPAVPLFVKVVSHFKVVRRPPSAADGGHNSRSRAAVKTLLAGAPSKTPNLLLSLAARQVQRRDDACEALPSDPMPYPSIMPSQVSFQVLLGPSRERRLPRPCERFGQTRRLRRSWVLVRKIPHLSQRASRASVIAYNTTVLTRRSTTST